MSWKGVAAISFSSAGKGLPLKAGCDGVSAAEAESSGKAAATIKADTGVARRTKPLMNTP
ncbi:hypothetical protein KH5H1_32340 [Corallococcus caeni]|nr:hypothetical protein KH5H1_32340 [Corallococcus sp. KH5-1]